MKQIGDAWNSVNPTYDKVNGYVSGNKINDKDLNMNIMNFDMKVKSHGVVRGLTVHEGRDALVIDSEGTISLDGNSGHLSGYMLIDVLTGFPVLDEGVMHIPLRLKSELKQLFIKQTQTLKLPPMRNKPVQKAGGSIEERLAKLKKLLEKGLLTPDEAAEKRKEILNSL
jgi:hypothetical protein